MTMERGPDHPELNDEANAIWERLAAEWHEEVGEEGNAHSKYIHIPATRKLLDIQPGDAALDIACGSGIYSRLMAADGASVIGIDMSETFLGIAREINDRDGRDIAYRRIDATDYDQLIALGESKFDAINCMMGVMNFASLTPLARALPKLLKPNGRFVFAVPHPAFNRYTARLGIEQDLSGNDPRRTLTLVDYLDSTPVMGKSIPGQPEPKWDFDRPIGMLLNAFFEHGLVLDCLEEPAFPAEVSGSDPTSWANYKEFPPALIARLRKL